VGRLDVGRLDVGRLDGRRAPEPLDVLFERHVPGFDKSAGGHTIDLRHLLLPFRHLLVARRAVPRLRAPTAKVNQFIQGDGERLHASAQVQRRVP
jgi:hypothetical protein